MEGGFFDLVEFLKKPTVVVTFVDILICAVPIWVAVMIGLVIGWSWRPRWTGLIFLGLRSKFRFLWTLPPGLGARRLWLAFTALSAFSVGRRLWFNCRVKSKQPSALGSDALAEGSGADNVRTLEQEQDIITRSDLEHLWCLTEGNAGDMSWRNLMTFSTPSFHYEAWYRDPEAGPTMYHSRTVFEDATPELVRDFFWDDDFRPKWDPMLSYFKILEECSETGTMIVHWIRKFPFFCSDREYIIGRRIWKAGNTFYCVTKGVPYPGLSRGAKPRRVDIYFSSWSIKAVQSGRGEGQPSACEVRLIHYEDMGIPKDVAKLGVRHGMRGAVKKLHLGLRAYRDRAALSRSAEMATITTEISSDEIPNVADHEEERGGGETVGRDWGIDWKWVAIGGGAVVLACGLHTGVIGKALLIGAAGRRIGRR